MSESTFHCFCGQEHPLSTLGRPVNHRAPERDATSLDAIIRGVRNAEANVAISAPVSKADMGRLLDDIAIDLESLRDRGHAPAPRMITTSAEADQLPTGSVIVDDSGSGPAWVIEETMVTHTAVPGMEGRMVCGAAGVGGTSYSVKYPAIVIHTPTIEETP
jgi:hypothetical protein